MNLVIWFDLSVEDMQTHNQGSAPQMDPLCFIRSLFQCPFIGALSNEFWLSRMFLYISLDLYILPEVSVTPLVKDFRSSPGVKLFLILKNESRGKQTNLYLKFAILTRNGDFIYI